MYLNSVWSEIQQNKKQISSKIIHFIKSVYFRPVTIYERHMKNGEYTEYTEISKSNQNWIIARTVRTKEKDKQYWILDKNFTLDTRYTKTHYRKRRANNFIKLYNLKLQDHWS
jgi:hypothetical protein